MRLRGWRQRPNRPLAWLRRFRPQSFFSSRRPMDMRIRPQHDEGGRRPCFAPQARRASVHPAILSNYFRSATSAGGGSQPASLPRCLPR
jgi:hypothetical protein